MEAELASGVGGNQLVQHQAPEQFGEYAHRQKEALAAGDAPKAASWTAMISGLSWAEVDIDMS